MVCKLSVIIDIVISATLMLIMHECFQYRLYFVSVYSGAKVCKQCTRLVSCITTLLKQAVLMLTSPRIQPSGDLKCVHFKTQRKLVKQVMTFIDDIFKRNTVYRNVYNAY